jgi:hypothetical protein
LALAFVKKLEIVSRQITDGLSMLIAHDDRNEHKVDFALESWDLLL